MTVTVHARQIEQVATSALRRYARNAKTHSDAQVEAIARVIREHGFTQPLLIDGDGEIIAGHGRLEAALRVGLADVPCIRISGLTPEQVRALRISDNRLGEIGTGWDADLLRLELAELDALKFDISLTGFPDLTLPELDLPSPGGAPNPGAGSLADLFGVPPFSVLNAREGWWQDRKRAWIALGIRSELGRGEGATYGESDAITEPGLNHYRDAAKANAPGARSGAGGGYIVGGGDMRADPAYDKRGANGRRLAAMNNEGLTVGRGGLSAQAAAKANARNAAKAPTDARTAPKRRKPTRRRGKGKPAAVARPTGVTDGAAVD